MSAGYTLAELLETTELHLTLLAGPPASLRRPVSGAHSIEVECPARWLGHEWVMLTTGLLLQDDEAAQRELIRELDAAGISGLGFAVGVVLPEAPAALLDEADRRRFPVFAVPLETPLRDVIAVVHNSLLSSELRGARRLASVQQYLVDGLKEPDPRRAVLERFSAMLDVRVVALDAGSAESFGSGPGEPELRAALDGLPPVSHELRVGDWKAFAVPMPSASGRTAWLVAASRRATVQSGLIKAVTQSVVSLLAATNSLGQAARRQDRALRAAVLEALLRADPGDDPRTLGARAAAFGLDLRESWHVAVVTSCRGRESIDRLLDVIEEALPAGAAVLAAVDGDGIVALIQGAPSALGGVLETVLAADDDALVGVGRAVDDVQEIDRSYRDARCALQSLRRAPANGRHLLRFEEMDVGAIVISEAGTSRVRSRVRPILAFLREHEPLAEAVVTYFEENMDVARASDRLFLHPNSLRYRLRRVEEMLGLSLKDPAAITNLYIALLADREESADAAHVSATPA